MFRMHWEHLPYLATGNNVPNVLGMHLEHIWNTFLIWQVTSKHFTVLRSALAMLYQLTQKPYTLEYSQDIRMAQLGYLQTTSKLYGFLDYSKTIKLKYHQLLNLKLYSQFSNLASKGSMGWWLENCFVSPKPQTHWNLSVLVFLKP